MCGRHETAHACGSPYRAAGVKVGGSRLVTADASVRSAPRVRVTATGNGAQANRMSVHKKPNMA